MQGQPIPVVLVPLRDRWGNARQYALVDPADAERVNLYRWSVRSSDGYVAGIVDGRHRALHQFIYGVVPDGLVLDHRNRWPLDNRRANLRVCTTAENAQNQGSRGGSSCYRGVTWDKSRQKWMATGMRNGRRTTIGRFDSEEAANAAACAWRAEHMPFSPDAQAAA